MNSTLQRAVTSFYNLVYEAQTFATTMARLDTADQEHYAGKIEGLNWVCDLSRAWRPHRPRRDPARSGEVAVEGRGRLWPSGWSLGVCGGATRSLRLVGHERQDEAADVLIRIGSAAGPRTHASGRGPRACKAASRPADVPPPRFGQSVPAA